MSNEIIKYENFALQFVEDDEMFPEVISENTTLQKLEKLPLNEIGALGNNFLQMVKPLQVTQTVSTNAEGIYKCVFPNGVAGTLAQAKDGSGALGTIIQDGKGFVGQARWQQIDELKQVTTTSIPVDPASMFMAAALMSIEKKLDEISETQKDMFDFMKQKEESEIDAAAKFLKEDIMGNYKYQYDNELWKNAHYQKIVDIKLMSKGKIEFYQKRINEEVNKNSLIVTDSSANKKAQGIYEDLKNYQKALFLNSYSIFMEVMLNKNFDSAYLSKISDELANKSYSFRKLYTKCYNAIDSDSKKSLDKFIRTGAAETMYFMGNTAEKIPLIKNTETNKALENAGDGIKKYNHKQKDKYLNKLRETKGSVVVPFVDMIDKMNIMYNQPIAIVCDNENMYISSAVEKAEKIMEE